MLVAIDGLRVDAPAGLELLLAQYRPGDRVTIHVFRRDELRAFRVRLRAGAGLRAQRVPSAGRPARRPAGNCPARGGVLRRVTAYTMACDSAAGSAHTAMRPSIWRQADSGASATPSPAATSASWPALPPRSAPHRARSLRGRRPRPASAHRPRCPGAAPRKVPAPGRPAPAACGPPGDARPAAPPPPDPATRLRLQLVVDRVREMLRSMRCPRASICAAGLISFSSTDTCSACAGSAISAGAGPMKCDPDNRSRCGRPGLVHRLRAHGRVLEPPQRDAHVVQEGLAGSVSATRRLLRSNSFTPSSRSSCAICRLSGGCEICRRAAARVKFSSSASTAK